MCLVFCGDYIIPYIGSVLLFYFAKSAKKFGFSGVRSLSNEDLFRICSIRNISDKAGTKLQDRGHNVVFGIGGHL